jgi:hypothetical protein
MDETGIICIIKENEFLWLDTPFEYMSNEWSTCLVMNKNDHQPIDQKTAVT